MRRNDRSIPSPAPDRSSDDSLLFTVSKNSRKSSNFYHHNGPDPLVSVSHEGSDETLLLQQLSARAPRAPAETRGHWSSSVHRMAGPALFAISPTTLSANPRRTDAELAEESVEASFRRSGGAVAIAVVAPPQRTAYPLVSVKQSGSTVNVLLQQLKSG